MRDMATGVRLREFQERDYARLAEIEAAIDPESVASAESLRERDTIDEPRIRVRRFAAETPTGLLVGAGRVMHIWFNFHPRKYMLHIRVDPAWQRHGIGTLLLSRLLAELQEWHATLVRTDTRESYLSTISFLEHRGFSEWRRRWTSVLEIASARTDSLRNGDRRVAGSGIRVTTYATEQHRRGDALAHDVWQLEDFIFRADPNNGPEGEGMSFERFVATELACSEALPDANFLAYAGDQLVGVSRLARDRNRPGALDQAFTGTHPEFRGRGIAQALKLRTIEYAQAHGYREIHTTNDSTNDPMLHINAAIGFRRGPAILVFERRLAE
jgi:GNAT superfamily N-acetyltransferase